MSLSTDQAILLVESIGRSVMQPTGLIDENTPAVQILKNITASTSLPTEYDEYLIVKPGTVEGIVKSNILKAQSEQLRTGKKILVVLEAGVYEEPNCFVADVHVYAKRGVILYSGSSNELLYTTTDASVGGIYTIYGYGRYFGTGNNPRACFLTIGF